MSLASDLIQRVQIGGKQLLSAIDQGVGSASEFVRKNPVTSAVGVSGGVLAGVTAIQVIRKKRKASSKTTKKKSKARKKKPATRRNVSKKKKKKSSYYKGRTSTRTNTKRNKVYYTKGRHQPYIILANGRAKFIKKSSASRMRKTKGGYK